MDLQMPEMDGFETSREIRARFGSQPFIVAVTANALPSDKQACLDAGMDNHVGKPLDLERLVQTILQGKAAQSVVDGPQTHGAPQSRRRVAPAEQRPGRCFEPLPKTFCGLENERWRNWFLGKPWGKRADSGGRFTL